MSISALFAVAAVALGVQDAPRATSIGVSPISIDQSAEDRTAVVNLRNRGDRPVTLQVRLFRWTQVDGEDVLVRTDEVVASPPIAVVEPGRSNIVRIVRVADSPPASEDIYRLIIDELPDSTMQEGGTVQLVVRHSIPVFFQPTRPGMRDLTWSIEQGDEGPRLRVTNTGGRHARLARLVLSNSDGEVWRRDGLLGYVLPGSSMSWPLPDASYQDMGELSATAQTALGQLTVRVPVEN